MSVGIARAAALARVAPGSVRLLGTGLALPGPAVSTEALCQRLDAQFGLRAQRYARQLAPRLQVATRHLCRAFDQPLERARDGQRNPELAAQALSQALAQAGLRGEQLGYLITHTATPARALPGGSGEVARRVAATCPHAELRQACTGFANALQFALALLREPGAAPVAIVGSETGSLYFDPRGVADDPAQWVNALQMGDGAAAVVLGPDSAGDGPRLSTAYFGQWPQPFAAGLWLDAGGSDHVDAPLAHFGHDFGAVAREGGALLEAGAATLARAGWSLGAARFVIPHQASGAVADAVAAHFGLARERVSDQAQRVGNLGSASIWAATHEALGQMRPGDLALVLGAEATQHSFGGFALQA